MKPKLAIVDGFHPELFEKLKTDTRFDLQPQSKYSQEEILSFLPEVEGLVIRSATTVDPSFLEKAKNLKLVIRAGEGTDNIDKVSCQSKGVAVANTPGANNNSAAEHAISLMFSVLRHTATAHASMREGKWEKSKFTGLEMSQKTIGIIGMGRIGQIVARRLQGFDPKILFYDPFIEKVDLPNCQKANTLDEVFKNSDIITLHLPKMEATKNLIAKDLLDQMRPNGIFINAARGGIVNEEALVQVLKEKKIRGAGIDVFGLEPLPSDNPFKELDNIVLTPHLGASTEEAQFRVGEMAINQLIAFFCENKLLNEVRA